MAPSVKPAARLSERPLPGSAGPSSSFVAAAAVRVSRSRGAPAPASLQIPRCVRGIDRLVAVPPAEDPRARGCLGVGGAVRRAASPATHDRCAAPARANSWTSDQARRPAELKHINKRRKRN